jgi:Protein of unknown function (DUF3574)
MPPGPAPRDPRWLLTALLLAALAGCAAPLPAPGADLVRTELIFGRAVPGGGYVSEAEWRVFVAEQIAPRLDGFTVFPVTGQSRTQAGTLVAEESFLVLVLHPPTAASGAAIEAIRAAYRQRFHQETVPRVSAPARVSF